MKKQEWEDDRCRFRLLPRQETIITLQGLGLQNRLNSRNYDLPMNGSDCDQNMHGNLIDIDYYNKWRSGWITFGCRTLTWQTQSAPTFTQPHSLNRVPRLSLKFTHWWSSLSLNGQNKISFHEHTHKPRSTEWVWAEFNLFEQCLFLQVHASGLLQHRVRVNQ